MTLFKQQYAQMRAGDETVSREKPPFYFDIEPEELQTLIQRSEMEFNNRTKRKYKRKQIKLKNSIKVRRENGKYYKFIAVTPYKLKPLHRALYEKHHGQIPKTHHVVFLDGNTLNCEPSNLGLISKKDHLKNNYNREKARESLKDAWVKRKKTFNKH